MAENSCPICVQDYQTKGMLNPATLNCRRCGTYSISYEAACHARSLSPEERTILSGWIRERTEHNRPVEITNSIVANVSQLDGVPQTIPDKLNRLLLNLARKTDPPGKPVRVDLEYDHPLAYAKETTDLLFFIESLKEQGLIRHTDKFQSTEGFGETVTVVDCYLKADGWTRVEQLSHVGRESKQCFVAMSFSKEKPVLTKVYEAIRNGVQEADFDCYSVKDEPHNDKICDRIAAGIKSSRFLLADVTEHKQNVYFEAGMAMGLGLQVIWTCEETDIDNAHFDTRQYKHILWKKGDWSTFSQAITDHIRATIR